METDSESLRTEMDRRRAAGEHFSLKEVVALMVPLISDLAERHGRGATLFVHPNAILHHPSGGLLDAGSAALMPENPRDRACLAPEQRQGAPGDLRASVFACGAILYELVTGECVGPGMRRPSEVVRTLPRSFEQLLGKALVTDVEHRPADLPALAQALHDCAPTASIPPPRADESHLDHDDGFDVDVSLSMLPPPPNQTALLEAELARRAAANSAEPAMPETTATSVLAELKARLEADPRPRYIVIRDGMDHGPFSAVELLHQVATGNFLGDNVLRDSLSKEERPIDQWDEFAPFAEQARLSQEAESERHALEEGVEADKQQTQVKAFVAAGVLFIAAAAFLGWYFQTRLSQEDELAVSGQEGQSVDFDGGLKGRSKKGGARGGGPWRGGGRSGDGSSPAAGSHPVVPGGLSCSGARNRYVEEYNMGSGENKVPPDLSAGAYGAVLNRGNYLNSCGVPPTMSVSICAAVQNGRAVGVTVSTKPANGTVAGCVAGRIRSISFPSHPRLDITTTVFKAE